MMLCFFRKHSTTDNESDWKRAFKGEEVLSHRSSLSGGVGILFAQSFLPFSFIPGVLLKVKAAFENVKLVFLNVYTNTKLPCPLTQWTG